MRNVNRSALVPYSAGQMFALVDDVESYPEFLPWCSSAVVHARDDSKVDATVEFRRAGIRKSFRTHNTRRPDESIDLELIDGPFRHLAGGWQFLELGDEGSKVALSLAFEFDSRLADLAFGPLFEETCNSLVGAFIDRAADVYGG